MEHLMLCVYGYCSTETPLCTFINPYIYNDDTYIYIYKHSELDDSPFLPRSWIWKESRHHLRNLHSMKCFVCGSRIRQIVFESKEGGRIHLDFINEILVVLIIGRTKF